MGRIVRELNASLDVDRAMRITLEWAMRQSNAEAGLIGMIEEEQIRLMAQEGYEEVFTDPSNGHLPMDMPTIKPALESGQPSQVSLIAVGETGLLPPRIRRSSSRSAAKRMSSVCSCSKA
jgi:hypothetical protein